MQKQPILRVHGEVEFQVTNGLPEQPHGLLVRVKNDELKEIGMCSYAALSTPLLPR